MEKIKQFSDRTIIYLLPMAFLSSGFIGAVLLTVAYPYFIDHENIRILITIAVSIILWFCLFFNILSNIKKHSKTEILLVLIFLLATIFPLFFSVAKYGMDMQYIEMIGRYCLFVTMFVFIAIILNREKKYFEFISTFKWYGLAAMPFSVIYILRMLQVEKTANEFMNIGGMSYTMVASLLFSILLASIVEITGRTNGAKQSNGIINWCIVFLFGITIIYSGSRSILLALIWSTVLSFFMFFRKNDKFNNIRLTIISSLIFFMLLFSACVWAPISSGFGEGGRSHNMISSEFDKSGFDMSLQQKRLDDIIIHEVVYSSEKVEITIDDVKKKIIDGEIYKDNLENNEFTLEQVEDYEFITQRLVLYKYAWEEFKKTPVFGNGFLYYQNKYGTYPHNWFLENLCDRGIIYTIFINIMIIVIIVLVIKETKGNHYARGIIFICMAYIPVYMLSGSIYINETIIFSVVFATLYILKKNKLKI